MWYVGLDVRLTRATHNFLPCHWEPLTHVTELILLTLVRSLQN